MPDEWAASVVVLIFKGKGDAMSCRAYRDHAMKIVEKMLERRVLHMLRIT